MGRRRGMSKSLLIALFGTLFGWVRVLTWRAGMGNCSLTSRRVAGMMEMGWLDGFSMTFANLAAGKEEELTRVSRPLS